MADDTEDIRRQHQAEINSGNYLIQGPTWTTEQLAQDFDVEGFLAPYVVVRRKSDGQRGTLAFRHSPRIYFGWQPDNG